MNKSQTQQNKIAIDNIQGDIDILILQNRFKKDTSLRKEILIEKLNLLYSMDIISADLYFEYMETINSLYL